MKIVITGGLGFILSSLAHYLKSIETHNTQKYDILILDKGSYAGSRANLLPLKRNQDYKLELVDIADPVMATGIIKEFKPDILINGASSTHVDNSLKDPYPFIHDNILGLTTLLEIIKKHPVKHFIQISTDEVLKHEKPEFIPSYLPGLGVGRWSFNRPMEDTGQYHTTSPYSASKASAEMVCKAYMAAWGLPISIIRCTNNYGPRQHKEKLIPKIIHNALTDQPIPLYGKGDQWRDWLYVDDFCSAIALIMEQEPGEIWHVAANREEQNIWLIKKILKVMGKPEGLIKFVKDRPGHDESYSLNCNKLKSLGWAPKTSLDEGLRKTIEWVTQKKILE